MTDRESYGFVLPSASQPDLGTYRSRPNRVPWCKWVDILGSNIISITKIIEKSVRVYEMWHNKSAMFGDTEATKRARVVRPMTMLPKCTRPPYPYPYPSSVGSNPQLRLPHDCDPAILGIIVLASFSASELGLSSARHFAILFYSRVSFKYFLQMSLRL